jgi:hypothetical protein
MTPSQFERLLAMLGELRDALVVTAKELHDLAMTLRRQERGSGTKISSKETYWL